MNPQPRSREIALTILVIATAIVGFGLFRGEFIASGVVASEVPAEVAEVMWYISRIKWVCGMAVIVHYLQVFLAVRRILVGEGEATGRQIEDGALNHTFWQMLYVVVVFALDMAEDSLLNSEVGRVF